MVKNETVLIWFQLRCVQCLIHKCQHSSKHLRHLTVALSPELWLTPNICAFGIVILVFLLTFYVFGSCFWMPEVTLVWDFFSMSFSVMHVWVLYWYCMCMCKRSYECVHVCDHTCLCACVSLCFVWISMFIKVFLCHWFVCIYALHVCL